MIVLNVGLNVHKLYYRLCLRFSLCDEEIFLACHVMCGAVGGAVAKVVDSENWLSWSQLLALTSPSLCTQHLFMCKHSGFLHPLCVHEDAFDAYPRKASSHTPSCSHHTKCFDPLLD